MVFVSLQQIGDMLGNAGAFDPANRDSEWSYMNTESKGGGKLDFSYSSIPSAFSAEGASQDPLTNPSPMLFIAEGDTYAHNHMNFGNFLWGAAGHSLGFGEVSLKGAAHYNSVFNSDTNGYKSQLDSKDDQRSIGQGVQYSRTNQFRDRTWSPAAGLSLPATKKRYMRMRLMFFAFFAFALQSCQSQNVDSVIDKYDREDFSELSGMSLFFRSKGGPMSTIYFVNQYKGTCSPYIVEVKNDDHSVIAIKNDLVLKSCGKDYLQREEIERAIKKFISYDICLLQVDSEGNVYINPTKQERPTLLRKSPNSTPADIKQFELYKGDWYLRK